MNNTLKIIILSIIALFLLSIMILIINGGFNIFNITFNKENNLLYEEEYENKIDNIKINSISSDIKVVKSDNDAIKVVIYGDKKEDYKVKLDNNTLSIESDLKNKICIGFCFSYDNITLYLPENFTKALDINTVSGDINLETNINSNANLKTKSGDVSVDSINNVNVSVISGDIDIKNGHDVVLNTKSGDISIGDVLNIEAETISGDINVNNININKDGYLKTVSGDIYIKNSNSIYYETKTTSGDVKINNNDRYAQNTMKLSTVSGDIIVK